MKNLILLLIPFISFSQVEVPDEYWLDDSNFEEAISSGAFGDDNESTIVIEFWAKFNEENCFAEWDKLEEACLLYTSPSPRDRSLSRMPSSA